MRPLRSRAKAFPSREMGIPQILLRSAIDDGLAQNFASRETPVRFEPRIGVTSIEPAIDADGRLESVVVSFKDVQDGRADSVLVEYTPWLRK
jgi:phage baseplate assembly protein W